MSSPAEVDITVEFAFGSGPLDDLTSATWTDVTDYVVTPTSGPAVTCRTGREATRRELEPGEATFSLDNSDRRFDPNNSAGPYFGNLVNGVPVRITTTYSATSRTRWLGFLSSGWPQQLTRRIPQVDVTCHDLLGLAAAGSAPPTAFELEVDQVGAPDHWWTPEPTGWIDRVTGSTGIHTTGLVELDPVINGDAQSFGNEGIGGFAQITDAAARINFGSTVRVLSVWFRLPNDRPVDTFEVPTVLVSQQARVTGPRTHQTVFDLTIEADGIRVVIDDGGNVGVPGRLSYPFGSENAVRNLHDGRIHNIVVAFRNSGGFFAGPDTVGLYLDGVLLTNFGYDSISIGAATVVPGELRIGNGPATSVFNGTPYSGVIDHVMLWRDSPYNWLPVFGSPPVPDGDTSLGYFLVRPLWEAGRAAFAGQRLNERLEQIARGLGASERVGAFDESGIVTLQSYRQAEPLELMQRIEDTEQGRVWVDRQGDLRFSSRSWAWTDPASTSVQVLLTDDPADQDSGVGFAYLEAGTVIDTDPLGQVNVAEVNSTFGRQQTATNPTSIAAAGRRNVVQLSNLLHPSDAQSRAIAEWIIETESDPNPRPRRVRVHVDPDAPQLAPIMQELDIGALVELKWSAGVDCDGNPLGDDLELKAHVIGLEHEFGFEGWFVTLHLDSSRAGLDWFTWGVSEWDDGPGGWAF
jgi:hypothetical protein